jgi:hypothetical protein
MKIFARFSTDVSATIAALAALTFPVILGMAGLGVDGSMWIMQKRTLQTAVDAAVMSAAWEIANGRNSNADAAALREAQNNGYNPAKNGTLNIVIGQDASNNTTVTGTLQQRADLYFSKVIYSGTVTLATTAASTVEPPTSDYCMLALNPTIDGAIRTVGVVDVEATSCGMASNSSSPISFNVSGNVTLNVNDASSVGGITYNGHDPFSVNTTLSENQNPFVDPYANLATPNYTHCTANQIATHAIIGQQPSGNTYYPGVYCGGFSGSGTFSPGVYILDGGNFNVGNITGQGVSVVLTSSSGNNYGNVSMAGNSSLNITAPAVGQDMAGVAIYRDRAAPAGDNSFLGNSIVNVSGAVYMPTAQIDWGGTSGSTGQQCTRLIGDSIFLHGTPNIGNNCAGTGTNNIGKPSVKLTL